MAAHRTEQAFQGEGPRIAPTTRMRAWKSVGDLSRAESLFLVRRFEESLALYFRKLARLRSTQPVPSLLLSASSLPSFRHSCNSGSSGNSLDATFLSSADVLPHVFPSSSLPAAAVVAPPSSASTPALTQQGPCECRQLLIPIVKLLFELKRTDEILPFLRGFYFQPALIPPPVFLATLRIFVQAQLLDTARALAAEFFQTFTPLRRTQGSPVKGAAPSDPPALDEDGHTVVEIVRDLVFLVLVPLRQFDEARHLLQLHGLRETRDLLLRELADLELAASRVVPTMTASPPSAVTTSLPTRGGQNAIAALPSRTSSSVVGPVDLEKPPNKRLLSGDDLGGLEGLRSDPIGFLLNFVQNKRHWLLGLLACIALVLLLRSLIQRRAFRLPKWVVKNTSTFIELFIGNANQRRI